MAKNLEYKIIVYDPKQTVLEKFGQNSGANGANVSIVCRQKTLDDYCSNGLYESNNKSNNKTLYDFGQESE